jgi:ABC-type molybdate transport system substrate-binding protein
MKKTLLLVVALIIVSVIISRAIRSSTKVSVILTGSLKDPTKGLAGRTFGSDL